MFLGALTLLCNGVFSALLWQIRKETLLMKVAFDPAVPMDYTILMLTIAELSTFIRSAEKLLNADERQDVISYLAEHPKAGDVMEGTGGVRKLRWSRGSQGKSGGVRVIYYFHNESMPLYLLTLYAKNERSNLTKAQRNELLELTTLLVLTWKRKRNEH